MTAFYQTYDSPVRVAVAEDGIVTSTFVFQPLGNIQGFDGPPPDFEIGDSVEKIGAIGFKKRH